MDTSVPEPTPYAREHVAYWSFQDGTWKKVTAVDDLLADYVSVFWTAEAHPTFNKNWYEWGNLRYSMHAFLHFAGKASCTSFQCLLNDWKLGFGWLCFTLQLRNKKRPIREMLRALAVARRQDLQQCATRQRSEHLRFICKKSVSEKKCHERSTPPNSKGCGTIPIFARLD